jgi:hypothetical protein
MEPNQLDERAEYFPNVKVVLKSEDEIYNLVRLEIEETYNSGAHYQKMFEQNRDEKWEMFREQVNKNPDTARRIVKQIRKKEGDDYADAFDAILNDDFDKFSHLYEKKFQEQYKEDFENQQDVKDYLKDQIEENVAKMTKHIKKIAGRKFPVISFGEIDGNKIATIFCPVFAKKEYNEDYVLDLYTGPVERIPKNLTIDVKMSIVEQVGVEI